MRRALALSLACLALAACAPAVRIPPEGRESVIRALSRQPRYLRVAVYVAPFFGDGRRALLSDRPLEELGVLEEPGGKPLSPPPAQRILLPGTPVFVDTVQFPTGAEFWNRPVHTPRYNPWLLAWAEGEPRPAVLLISADLGRVEDLLAEVSRVLTEDDPTPLLRELPEGQREAIRRKDLVDGMGRSAAAMAWGYPDRMVMDRPGGIEEWSWLGSERKATFQDDRLTRFTRRPSTPGR
jgi:hypothetical protein